MFPSQRKSRILFIVDEEDLKEKFKLKCLKNKKTMTEVLYELVKKWTYSK